MTKRILAIMLTVAILFLSIPLSTLAASYSITIGPGYGSGADTTFSSNMDTIKNYSADEQVTVYVSNQGTGEANNPKLFGWRNDGDVPHKAVVTFTTKPGEDKATIYSGEGANFSIYGPTVLSNINVFVQNLEYGICTAGHSLSIDSTVKIGNNDGYGESYIDYAKIFVGGHANQGTSLSSEDGTVLLDGISLFGGNGGVILGGYGHVSPTIPGTQTVISKNNKINLIFAGSNDQTIFSKNLNVVLENATVNSVRSQWSSNSKTTVNGAIQILANGTSTLDADAVYAAAKGDAITAGSGVYVLDSSNKAGTLAITDVAGTYTVNSDHAYAYAYDALHNASTIYYGTDTLTIGKPGNYEVNYADSLEEIISILGGDWVVNPNGTITSGTQEAVIEYYITPNGAGDKSGRSESNAAPSITAAVQSIINDGYGEGDKVTIYVVNSASSSNMVPNFTWPWPNINDVSATTLASITVTTKPGVTAPALISYSEDFTIVANMTFKNVTLVDATGGNGIFTNGYNVTFDEDVTFKQGTGLSENIPLIRIGTSYEAGKRYDADGTLTINNTTGNKKYKIAFAGYTWDGREGSSANTLFGRKSVVINGGDVEELYLLGLNYKAEYNSDINVVLNGANLKKAGVTMFEGVTPVIGGALQFIANNGATLPNMLSIQDYAEENKIPYYELSAISGANGTLSVTENAGTYAVDSENTYACAYSESQPDTMYYGTDTLTVKGQGKYSVGYLDNLADVAYVIPGNWVDNGDGTMTLYPEGTKIGKYYITPNGAGDKSGRSESDAAPSITAAVQSIINDGYGEGDKVTIYVVDSESSSNMVPNFTWPWPNINEVCETTPASITVTTKPGVTAPALISYSEDFTVVANTTFKNITLVDATGGNGIFTNGYNVTFDEDVTFKQGTGLSENIPLIRIGTSYEAGKRYDEDGTLTINNTTGNKKYKIAFAGYTWDGREGSSANALFGRKSVVINGGDVEELYLLGLNYKAEYNSDINVVLNGANLKKAGVTLFEGVTPVIGGALQIIANNGASLPDMSTIKAYANEKNIPYYVIDASTASLKMLDITDSSGSYKVRDGYTVLATNLNDKSQRVPSTDGRLSVSAGEWSVLAKDPYSEEFSDYINYRQDLSNTYSKLAKGDEVNVVYFGGSVTNGYGASNINNVWRVKLGNWLQANFPDATVNNINKACGESGTYLGSYRLARDVISENPDLLVLEYSINDFYDYAGYDRAAYQYETIVRQVKEVLPNCDIVTILVTESGLIGSARQGNLHTEAQAHEDMAVYYNIPTLHVGRRIADSLPDNYSIEKDWLGVLAIDNVHLTDEGNQRYFDVIKEFFVNSLIYGGYDAENPTTPTELPELKNEYLLDGDIKCIDINEDLLNRSEELGGKGLIYRNGSILSGYEGIYDIAYSEGGNVLAIEFEGTELIGHFQNYNKNMTFEVSVDGSAYVTKNFYHMNPTTIVTGLDSGKHTILIKFNVSDSITDATQSLKLGALFSRDAEKRTAKQYDINVEGGNAYTVLSGENFATTAGTEVNVTLKANIPVGCTFVGWEVISGEVTLVDVSAETTTFKMTTAPVSIKAIYKDILDDGSFDVRDLVRLKKYLAGSITSIGDYADYNNDGAIDAADLVTLRKIIIGAIEPPTGEEKNIETNEVEATGTTEVASEAATINCGYDNSANYKVGVATNYAVNGRTVLTKSEDNGDFGYTVVSV